MVEGMLWKGNPLGQHGARWLVAPTCIVSKLSQGPDRERGVLKSVLLEFSPAGNLAGAADAGLIKTQACRGFHGDVKAGSEDPSPVCCFSIFLAGEGSKGCQKAPLLVFTGLGCLTRGASS